MTTGALANQLDMAPEIVSSADRYDAPRFARPVQGQLFPSSNVIRIEDYAPVRPRTKPQASRVNTASRPAKRGQSRSDKQASLDFLPPTTAPKKLSTTVDAKVYCDAPVADVLHRAVASALDWLVVLAAYVMFLGAYRMLGGEIVLDKVNILILIGAWVLIAFTYGVMWTLAGRETAGMHWTGLRLITFEGFPLDGRHRSLRLLGSCISLCAGIAMLWPLADEEGLSWPDHISSTFPTPLSHETATFRHGAARRI
jgi:uncharacterized RDD family membrane protein YckC